MFLSLFCVIDMPVGSPQFWRSRGFAIGIHVGLWVLLFLVIRNLGGKAPDLQDSASSLAPVQSVVPIPPANQR